MTIEAAAPRAGLRLALSLGLVAVLGPAGIDMYLASMPEMAQQMNSSYASVQLSLTVFLLAMGAGQLLFGPLVDMVGRRRPLLAGIVLFIVAALWTSQASTVNELLVARFLQGMGAALTLVVALSTVRDVAEGVRATQLFALLMTIEGLAPVLAPALGGVIDAHFGWRAVMLTLAALGGVALLNTLFFLPETLPVSKRSAPSGVMRTYLRIASDRQFLLPALALAAAFFFLFAYIGGAALVYQQTYGLAPDTFGLVFGATGSAVLFGAVTSARLVARHGVSRLGVAGTAAMLVGALIALASAMSGPSLAGVVAGMFVAMFGLGIAESTLMSMAMASQQRALGSTAALLGAFQLTIASAATPLAGALAQIGAVPWLTFLCALGLLVSLLALLARASARGNIHDGRSLAAH
jgi:DHA1 family bicyclomycin/chloramphenicol resistance-like MFS transporter